MQKFEYLSQMMDKTYVDPGTLRMKQIDRNKFVIHGTMMLKVNVGPEIKVPVDPSNPVLG